MRQHRDSQSISLTSLLQHQKSLLDLLIRVQANNIKHLLSEVMQPPIRQHFHSLINLHWDDSCSAAMLPDHLLSLWSAAPELKVRHSQTSAIAATAWGLHNVTQRPLCLLYVYCTVIHKSPSLMRNQFCKILLKPLLLFPLKFKVWNLLALFQTTKKGSFSLSFRHLIQLKLYGIQLRAASLVAILNNGGIISDVRPAWGNDGNL